MNKQYSLVIKNDKSNKVSFFKLDTNTNKETLISKREAKKLLLNSGCPVDKVNLLFP